MLNPALTLILSCMCASGPKTCHGVERRGGARTACAALVTSAGRAAAGWDEIIRLKDRLESSAAFGGGRCQARAPRRPPYGPARAERDAPQGSLQPGCGRTPGCPASAGLRSQRACKACSSERLVTRLGRARGRQVLPLHSMVPAAIGLGLNLL